MPVVVRELVVRATVDSGQRSADGPEPTQDPRPMTDDDIDRVVAAVLAALRRKKER